MATNSMQVSCSDCGGNQTASNCWWCRNCLRSVCDSCNLRNSHTEHDSRRWDRSDILSMCASALESRCSLRSKMAADEEIRIREVVSQIEEILSHTIRKRLENVNERDRLVISRLNKSLQKHRDDSMKDGLVYNVSSPNGPAWKFLGEFNDEQIDSLLNQVSAFADLTSLSNANSPERTETISFHSDFNAERFAKLLIRECLKEEQVAPIAEHDGFNSIKNNRPVTSTPLSTSESREMFRLPLEPSIRIRQSINESETTTASFPVTGCDETDSVKSQKKVVTIKEENRKRLQTPSQLGEDDPCSQHSFDSTSTDSTRLNILSFHFGQEFLSRPIDLCSLPGYRLAISDSCGGVYIVSSSGDILKRLTVDGGSASSVYVNSFDKTLLVSVMQKEERLIYIFAIELNFDKVTTIPMPTVPKIDFTRTRWLAVGARGELFVASGDNRKSAIWRYSYTTKSWSIVLESSRSRYQYLDVAEDQPDQQSVVLMTCDAVSNRLWLFTVDKKSKCTGSYDLTKIYTLNDYIRCPASAIVDLHGNVLILDYSNGKLWILVRSDQRGLRRIRVLAEIGSQEGMGICIQGEWCYLACFGKKRIQAIRYFEADCKTPIVQETQL